MSSGDDYAQQLRAKLIAGIHWRDTSESRRVIRELMVESLAVLKTPAPGVFDERERVLREAGRSLSRVAWDRQVFGVRDLLASGSSLHMSRIVRWCIHCGAVSVHRSKHDQNQCQTN